MAAPQKTLTGWQFQCAECGKEFSVSYNMSKARAAKPKFCCTVCQSKHAHKKSQQNAHDRFWAKVEVLGDDQCWNWKNQKNKKGYGLFNFSRGNETTLAHRIAFKIANGYLPNDRFVCHSCDNPSCCNPSHLWLGTPKDNTVDMMEKGRWKPADPIRGENASGAKLSNKDVQEIRSSGDSTKTLARRYGVSTVRINQILSRKAWTHV